MLRILWEPHLLGPDQARLVLSKDYPFRLYCYIGNIDIEPMYSQMCAAFSAELLFETLFRTQRITADGLVWDTPYPYIGLQLLKIWLW